MTSLRYSPITQFELNYHPDYGLADSTRAEVLRLVKVDGLSVREAAARSKLHPTTVYKWLSHISNKDL